MEKNIETEYKLLVTKESFEALLRFYPQAVFHTQVNTYFDNEAGQLQNLHGAMRIRNLGKECIYTLKMPSDEGLLEFETPVASNELTILNKPEIQNLLKSYEIVGPFHITAELSTQRAVIDTGEAELCFDINDYCGNRDYEIEYEITKPHDGIATFHKIIEQANLHYEKNCASKIKRALDAQCRQ